MLVLFFLILLAHFHAVFLVWLLNIAKLYVVLYKPKSFYFYIYLIAPMVAVLLKFTASLQDTDIKSVSVNTQGDQINI